jgi:hypothetical protein
MKHRAVPDRVRLGNRPFRFEDNVDFSKPERLFGEQGQKVLKKGDGSVCKVILLGTIDDFWLAEGSTLENALGRAWGGTYKLGFLAEEISDGRYRISCYKFEPVQEPEQPMD